jgi:hypothetical protein
MDDDPVNAAQRAGRGLPVQWTASSADQAVELARRWLYSSALDHLVRALGGNWRNPRELSAWSAATLDTRAGRERHHAPRVAWDDTMVGHILDAAEPLGLARTAPATHEAYDITMLLGGTATGNRLRTELAKQLATSGVDLGLLVIVAADRPLADLERHREAVADDQMLESENALANVQRAFGVMRPSASSGSPDARDRTMRLGPKKVRLLIAPPGGDRARANTVDAIRFAVARLAPIERARMLLVTSAIYAPYQFFVASPILLEAGASLIELIGTATAFDVDRRALAQRVGQEIHAAILAATQFADQP